MKTPLALFAIGRILLDTAAIFGGQVLAYFMRMEWYAALELSAPTTMYPFVPYLLFALQTTAFLVLVMALNGRYKFHADEKVLDEILHVFWAFSAGMAVLLVYFYFIQFTFFSRFIMGAAWGSGLVLMLVSRWLLRAVRRVLHRAGKGQEGVLVLGMGNMAIQALVVLSKSPHYHIIGVLSEKSSLQKKLGKYKVLGAFGNVESIIKKYSPDEILLASEKVSETMTAKLVRTSHIRHVRFRYLPNEFGLDLAAVSVSTLGNLPILTLLNTTMNGWALVMKSILDRIIAGIALVLLSPIMGIIALLVWYEKPKAALVYRSRRVGKEGREFNCLKFRTMIPNADKKKKALKKKNERGGGVFFKMENDPRVTRQGQVLRRWSLDELPQLWNVMRGEMSIIGPRPHLVEEVARYPKSDRRILSVKPGITGFSQINGRSSLSFEDEMNYELFYLKNWNLWLDVIIFFKSIGLVLRGHDAS